MQLYKILVKELFIIIAMYLGARFCVFLVGLAVRIVCPTTGLLLKQESINMEFHMDLVWM